MPDDTLTRETLAMRCAVLRSRMQCRVDACVERAGSETAAVTGPGVAISYLFARELAATLERVAEFLEEEQSE